MSLSVLKYTPEAASAAWRRVQKYIEPEPNTGCWLWTGSLFGSGYALTRFGGGKIRVHRLAYEQAVGPIPVGLVIDHLCRVRACVNPAHMEPVTVRENTMRGNSPTVLLSRSGRCKQGHVQTGAWRCRICRVRSNASCYLRRRSRRLGADGAFHKSSPSEQPT